MHIGLELPDLLEAHKKGIQRTPVNSFSYIVKSSGPQDVLLTHLTNLRVQGRQSRVCSTVAIAIVAEMCGPFTCIPAILNEYRTAELNVHTGCLKSLTFVFEYIGPHSAYYCDLVATLLEDALTDRDLVHRQISSVIVKHTALGVAGMGCEDSLPHLMNLAWPNGFETSPHCGLPMMRKLTPFSKPQRTSPICLEMRKHHPYSVLFIRSLYDHLDLDSPLDASVFGCLATSLHSTALLASGNSRFTPYLDPDIHVKPSKMCPSPSRAAPQTPSRRYCTI